MIIWLKLNYEFFITVFWSIFLILLLIPAIIQDILWMRKVEYLISIGFVRYVSGASEFGSFVWYAWKREKTHEDIRESELHQLSLQTLKERFK